MSYSELHKLVQSGDCYTEDLTHEICDKKLHQCAQDITGKRVTHITVEMDKKVWRGIYCSASETVQDLFGINNDVIITAEGLRKPWERFIFTKELMHIFEKDGVDSSQKLRSVFNQITNPTNPFSEDMVKETEAFYLALGVLCNERDRRLFHSEYKKQSLDYKDIGERVNLPEERMFHYFSERYLDVTVKHGAEIEM